VPHCYAAEESADGTLLVLEDLSAWRPGADPVVAARVLAGMHVQWERQADVRWPWLRRPGAAVDLVDQLYARTWPVLAARPDLPAELVGLGASLVGQVAAAEDALGRAGPVTLVHGDASTANMRTGPGAEVALLDWEDVSAAPGVTDLSWLLVSSVDPDGWQDVIAAYGPAEGLAEALPAAVVQGFLSFAESEAGSAEASSWVRRLRAAGALMPTAS
jgi:Phosphotransferase enzyme family